MAKTSNKRMIDTIKQKVVNEGGPAGISSCANVLLKAASFGKAKKKDLINAAVAAEFLYQAIFSHYWPGKGKGQDVIMGDYYGSLGIAYAARANDTVVFGVFCRALQQATKDEGDVAGRLAKIYGAGAFAGAYLAGLSGSVLDDFVNQGEQAGLQIIGKLL